MNTTINAAQNADNKKRKIDEKQVSSFLKKQNKKGKLSTYSFVKADPTIVTPNKNFKDVTLTQMGQVGVKEPPPPKEKIISKNRKFVAGSIVMINGHNFDHYKFSSVISAPTLYGVVLKDQSDAGKK